MESTYAQPLKLHGLHHHQDISQLTEVLQHDLSKYLGYSVQVEIKKSDEFYILDLQGNDKEISMRSYITSKVYKFFQQHPELNCTKVTSVAAEEHEKNLSATLMGDTTSGFILLLTPVLVCGIRTIYFFTTSFPENYTIDMLITFVVSLVLAFFVLMFIEGFIASS